MLSLHVQLAYLKFVVSKIDSAMTQVLQYINYAKRREIPKLSDKRHATPFTAGSAYPKARRKY